MPMYPVNPSKLLVTLSCLIGLMVMLGCTGAPTGTATDGVVVDGEAPVSDAPLVHTAVSMDPPAGASDINPAEPITLTANEGTMMSVSVTNNEGKEVQGELSADASTWTTTEPLGYARTYTATVKTLSDEGITSQFTGTVQTVVPKNQTAATSIPGKSGNTYGVGMPLIVTFDEPITDKDAAEEHMVVTTNPQVEGNWYWFTDYRAHWRPQNYYTPGTTVSLEMNIYGKDLGGGLYGQKDLSTSFTVGDSMVSKIDNADKQLKVYKNGELIRTMPASLGEPKYPSQSGVHVVQEKYTMKVMDSSTWGLPTDHPDGYYTEVPYAVRISFSGEFVHAAPWSVADQGVRNVSHGCINLSMENGKWFHDNSRYGDIVVIAGTEVDLKAHDGWGDWNVPWEKWQTGNK